MTQDRKLTHATRVLRIREMLDAQTSVSIAELMQTFGVSRRTVYNDLRALEDAGVPIYSDPAREGHWTMNYTAKRRTLTMTISQILALGVARQVLSFLEGTDLHAELATVTERMSRGLAPRYQTFMEQLHRKIAIVPFGPKSYADKVEILDELVTCLLYDERVELGYRPPGKGVRKHVVEPLALLVHAEALYLVGMSLTRKAHRVFAVDRITRAERLRGERFDYPADFSPQAFFDGSFGIFVDDEETDVELLFDADEAHYVRERTWHPSQSFEEADDGRTRMQVRVRGTFELLRWILGRSSSAEIVAPTALRKKAARILRAAAKRHSG